MARRRLLQFTMNVRAPSPMRAALADELVTVRDESAIGRDAEWRPEPAGIWS